MSTPDDVTTTDFTALVHGALEQEATERGVALHRLPAWARVKEALEPSSVCCTVLSGGGAGLAAAGAGGVAGGGPAKP